MERLIVYALNGSEYVAATLAALQSRNIKHAVKFVSIDAKKRTLPSGGKMLPEITYENPSKGIVEPAIVPDSAKIFEFLDTTFFGEDEEHQFCADKSDEYKALQQCASVELNAYVRYYAWVYKPTYRLQMRGRVMNAVLPPVMATGFMKGLGGLIVDNGVKKISNGIKVQVAKTLELCPPDSKQAVINKVVNDAAEPEIYKRLVVLLKVKLAPYVLKRRAENPDDFIGRMNSVECYTYAMLSRFFIQMGDTGIAPALADRLPKEEGLEELAAWVSELGEKLPLQYSNLRPEDVYPEENGENTSSGGAAAAATKTTAATTTTPPAQATEKETSIEATEATETTEATAATEGTAATETTEAEATEATETTEAAEATEATADSK